MICLFQKAEHRAMEELLKKLAEHFGYAAPFGYAVLAYGFFVWLDKELSDEAKAALARTMSFKDYKNEQIASALVEVFDRIYTYPLLRWRAFFRSLLFTTVVSAIFVFELYRYGLIGPRSWERPLHLYPDLALPFNVSSDYLSLFVIRPLLIRSGTKPVLGLTLGTVSGAAIVLAVDTLRRIVLLYLTLFHTLPLPFAQLLRIMAVPRNFFDMIFTLPAMAVFVWLPLFALGIVIARLLTPLSWIVGRAQWFLKEGNEHPLKAIGYVAAVVVFLGAVAGRAVFSA
jgi:hypothetical protein